MNQNVKTLTFAFAIGMASFAPQNGLASIVSPRGDIIDLGVFAAGTYNITGSGTVNLLGNGSFIMQPDGLPASPVTSPRYSYFNPAGSFIADGLFGPAGSNAKIGSLIGSFSATPANSNDWFLIGYQTHVTLSTSGHIYASINDTFYPNNTGFFEANVSAVPVPAAIWLFGSALAGFGVSKRSKKRV